MSRSAVSVTRRAGAGRANDFFCPSLLSCIIILCAVACCQAATETPEDAVGAGDTNTISLVGQTLTACEFLDLSEEAVGTTSELCVNSCTVLGKLALQEIARDVVAGDILPAGLLASMELAETQHINLIAEGCDLVFEECAFGSVSIIAGELPLVIDARLTFRRCTIDTLLMAGVTAAGRIAFEECQIGRTLVQSCCFLEEVTYRGSCHMDLVQDVGNYYLRPVDLAFAEYKAGAYFASTRFEDNISLVGTAFRGPLQIEDVQFTVPSDAAHMSLLASRTWMQAGDPEESAEYYYRHKVLARRSLCLPKRILQCVFLDLTCGYGTKWKRVLYTWLVIIVSCGLIYWVLRGVSRNDGKHDEPRSKRDWRSLMTCLYFSVVTFTTLGYGDYRARGFSRALASVEALLGITMLSLFVFVLARVYF